MHCNRHYRGMDDQALQRLVDQQQRSAHELQRRATEAQRTADAARKELARRCKRGAINA